MWWATRGSAHIVVVHGSAGWLRALYPVRWQRVTWSQPYAAALKRAARGIVMRHIIRIVCCSKTMFSTCNWHIIVIARLLVFPVVPLRWWPHCMVMVYKLVYRVTLGHSIVLAGLDVVMIVLPTANVTWPVPRRVPNLVDASAIHLAEVWIRAVPCHKRGVGWNEWSLNSNMFEWWAHGRFCLITQIKALSQPAAGRLRAGPGRCCGKKKKQRD